MALEAIAYEATTDDGTLRLLREAAIVVQQSIAARKDEKYFAESFTRISSNSLGYTRLKTLRSSMNMR